MKALLLVTLSLIVIFEVVAADAAPFEKALPKEDQPKAVISLKVFENLYLKLAKGFLVLSVTTPTSVEKEGVLQEGCIIKLSHIEHDRVTTESITSLITYSSTKIEGSESSFLQKKKGTQDYRRAGVDFSWSHASENEVYIYLPPNTQFSITKIKPAATKPISVKSKLLEALRTDSSLELLDGDTVIPFNVSPSKDFDEESPLFPMKLLIDNNISSVFPDDIEIIPKEDLVMSLEAYCKAAKAGGKSPKLWLQISAATKDENLNKLLIIAGKSGCSEVYIEKLTYIKPEK